MSGKEGVRRVLLDAIKNHNYGIVADTAKLFREYYGDDDCPDTKDAILVMRSFLDRLERACRNDSERAARKAVQP